MAEQRKRIVNNFISLSIVQGLSILFPLLIFPYLLQKLGVEGFGVFTLIQTVLMYGDLLVSFGFGLTATKAIAKNTGNAEQTNNVITSVFFIKMILFVIPLLIFLSASFFVDFLSAHFSLIIFSSIYVAGNIFFPDWYFQGVQKMRLITIVAFISKCVSFLLIVLFVKNPEDTANAILSLSVGNFIAGLTGFIMLARSFPLKMRLARKKYILALFKESAMVFSGIVLVPLYSSVNIFILQYFTNPLTVGYYAIAEKIYGAVSMLTSVANRTFYPHLTRLYKTAIPEFHRQVKKISMLFLLAFSFFAVCQFGFSDFIIEILSGKHEIKDIAVAVDILKIMSIAVLFSPFGSFYFQMLIIQGRKKAAVRNLFAVVIINFFSAGTLAYFFGGSGMAVNLCIIVFFVAFFNYYAFRQSGTAIKIRHQY